LVDEKLAEDGIGESALQTAQGLLGRLALEALALVVGPPRTVRMTDLGDRRHVQRVVETSVAHA
jgi:hypothetical protein